MKELKDIIIAYDKAVLQNKKTALATVVQVEGSSYRRPGARMLITEDGEITGAISGGCLEGDALRKAQRAMLLQQNKLLVYDTIHEDDQNLGIQLGCNGIVYILLEPIRHDDDNNPIEWLKKAARDRQAAVLVTIFNPQKNTAQTGTCLVVQENTRPDFQDARVEKAVSFVWKHQRSMVRNYPEHTVLYQYLPPSIHLVIVGAGNDVQPLVEMAYLLGWNITVADGRPAYATTQRFPKANHVCVAKANNLLTTITLDAQTAAVLMTHNYRYDVAALAQLVQSACGYIGVLGPKKKLEKMLVELAESGIATDTDNIYGPVGLDIGAETSAEIALSVVAEVKAVFSGREGTPLRNRAVEIHERSL